MLFSWFIRMEKEVMDKRNFIFSVKVLCQTPKEVQDSNSASSTEPSLGKKHVSLILKRDSEWKAVFLKDQSLIHKPFQIVLYLL